MPYGELSRVQKDALQPYVDNKVVHDLGAGDLALAHVLLSLGARGVVAVDKAIKPTNDRRIEIVQASFQSYRAKWIDVAFVSWPTNFPSLAPSRLVSLVEIAPILVYVGKNTDGMACGHPDFFNHQLKRPLLVEEPNRTNTMIITGLYRQTNKPRSPLPEEEAGLGMYDGGDPLPYVESQDVSKR